MQENLALLKIIIILIINFDLEVLDIYSLSSGTVSANAIICLTKREFYVAHC